jgi:hypothetical protein
MSTGHPHARAHPDRTQEALQSFLTDRLTEDLGRLWERDPTSLASLVGVVDDVLRVLATGRLPDRRDLDILLAGYSGHPDHDPAWHADL